MNLQINQGSWQQLIGRSHPLLVHLPIGILLLALVLALLSRRQQWQNLKAAIPVTLLAGFISAVCSCFTGYLLSLDGGYEDGILSIHQYLGIAVAVSSLTLYLLYTKWEKLKKWQLPGIIIIALLLSITGHYGGSLTHGDDYLSQAMPGGLRKLIGNKKSGAAQNNYTDIADARVYEDLVQPVLSNRCYSCHNAQKLKGGLRLESVELIRKGGEHGPVLKDSMPEMSELFKRLLLPENDEHRMPPKGKPGVSPNELALLQWWIAQGAPTGKKVKDLSKTPIITAVLEGMQGGGNIMHNAFVPEQSVAKADINAIQALIQKGVKVLAVGEENNFISITCINANDFDNADVALLLPLKSQLIWLDLSGTKITDSAFTTIAQLTQLTRLNVKQTKISGSTLNGLSSCQQLKYLNLSDNALKNADLKGLSKSKSLQQLYLAGSSVPTVAIQDLQTKLPTLKIDTGNISLAKLVTDTLVYHKEQGK
ncbi:hypothetical protein DVR12_15130 [Chitinophaga silvatica]|uniref:Uncharacterized protein n=1 Tax=Chitinophaga silvatica TaxID=2282649 RepID=A0A3E1Y9V3_9BACT|nr:c-type cytochrome domain-containing protein [Chitinophaga silvatica]RFS21976.1 hypothetical protein DVR12_15130 [Chitinophaga silvatica]